MGVGKLAKSSIGFNRWTSKRKNSWAHLVFKNQYTEIIKMHNSYKVVPAYVYKNLKNTDNSEWSDKASIRFGDLAKGKRGDELFVDLKEWSDYFNIFSKWGDYSSILALSGNFEIYIDKIVSIALESDVGLLIKSSKITDGIKLKKLNNINVNLNQINLLVTGCVKGTWYQRVNQFQLIFNWKPSLLEVESNIELLEKIRKIRNDAAHAYGRDLQGIKISQGLEVKDLKKIDDKLIMSYFALVYKLAKQIDKYLITNHIGEYHCLNFYHNLRISEEIILNDMHAHNIYLASEILRKRYGQYSSQPMGKMYYKELIKYYEKL